MASQKETVCPITSEFDPMGRSLGFPAALIAIKVRQTRGGRVWGGCVDCQTDGWTFFGAMAENPLWIEANSLILTGC